MNKTKGCLIANFATVPASARIMGVGLNTVLRHLKNSGRSR
ncbi:hypothetical protein G7002_27180 [Citrobacter freundii]|nr:hypothetical protein [Citrobacter freundii]